MGVLMGVFDDVRCVYPLPGGDQRRRFQTKSLENPYLRKAIVTLDGRLMLDGEEYRGGDYHGDLRIYSSERKGDWVEYHLRFSFGALVRIWDCQSQQVVVLIDRGVTM